MKKICVLSQDLLPVIDESFKREQNIYIRVSGTSMSPFLKHQKTVVSIKKIGDKIKKYDILLYLTKDKKLILHRVIKTGNPLILCGDGRSKTESIYIEQVLGIVDKIYNNDKPIRINSWFYKTKVKCWVHLRFFRRVLLKLFVWK